MKGGLAVSRAIGDLDYKNSQLNPKDPSVSPVPEVKVTARERGSDEFIIIACDGMWETMENDYAVKLIHRDFYDNKFKETLLSNDILAEKTESLVNRCWYEGKHWI